MRSDRQEVVLRHSLNDPERKKLKHYGLPVPQEVRLRLIKLRLPSGKSLLFAGSHLSI